MKHLAISLLGPFRATLNDQPIAFEADTARALLAWLAMDTAVAHPRENLADLFWPDRSTTMALQNLRQALSRLRQAIQDKTADPPFLQITRQSIQFNPVGNTWLDAAEFQRRLAAVKQHRHRCLEACRLCLEQLQAAAVLYRGDFLGGVSVAAAGFETWRRLRQEQLHGQALWVLDRLVISHAQRREYEQVQHYARRELELEPWHETAHAYLMWALALTGQRKLALNQYETCQHILAQELGIAPAEETTALYAAIRAGIQSNAGRYPLTPGFPLAFHNLPLSLTPFIGRKTELAKLAELLNDPHCRLLTLVGLGGIGKTRLALEVAQAHQRYFRDGVYFVSLAGLAPAASGSLPDQLAIAILTALQRSTHGSPVLLNDPRTTLRNFLHKKETLLVLDNFEQLVESAALLTDILQEAPGVVCLVTSRERLNLLGEWVFEVKGLDYPPLKSQMEAENYGAVQLFLHNARRARNDFEATPANLAAVIHICRLLQGLPLGIQLAAAWISTLACEQIAARIEADMYSLPALYRNVPERHRSLQAVFDHSWRLLNEQAQTVCSCLSVFHGDFDLAAAKAVAGASPELLTALVHKSLLQADAADRYELHPLLQHYAAEKLAAAPARQAETLERHGQYYLQRLGRQRAALSGNAVIETRAAIEADIENVRAAWRWAATHGQLEAINDGLEGLSRFYFLSGLAQEGSAVFGLAVEGVRAASEVEAGLPKGPALPAPNAQRRQVILGKLLAEQATFLNELAQYTEAIAVAQTVVELAQRHQAASLEIAGRLQWGQALWRQGLYPAAQARLEPALALARAESLPQALADCLRNLGIVAFYQGDYPTAQTHFEQALLLGREVGDRWGEGAALGNLGLVAQYQADFAQARDYFEQALNLYRQIGDPRREGIALSNLGTVLRAEGDYLKAKFYYEQTLHICAEIGDRWSEGIALANLGSLLSDLGDYANARTFLEQALQRSREIGDRYDEGRVLADLGLICCRLAESETAHTYGQQALLIAQELGDQSGQGTALTLLGNVLATLDRQTEAATAYQQALSLEQNPGPSNLEARAGLANLAFARGDPLEAQTYIEEILSRLGTGPSLSVKFFRVYSICYKVLSANQDPRAQHLLEHARHLLQAQASRISDEKYRRSFLDSIPAIGKS